MKTARPRGWRLIALAPVALVGWSAPVSWSLLPTAPRVEQFTAAAVEGAVQAAEARHGLEARRLGSEASASVVEGMVAALADWAQAHRRLYRHRRLPVGPAGRTPRHGWAGDAAGRAGSPCDGRSGRTRGRAFSGRYRIRGSARPRPVLDPPRHAQRWRSRAGRSAPGSGRRTLGHPAQGHVDHRLHRPVPPAGGGSSSCTRRPHLHPPASCRPRPARQAIPARVLGNQPADRAARGHTRGPALEHEPGPLRHGDSL